MIHPDMQFDEPVDYQQQAAETEVAQLEADETAVIAYPVADGQIAEWRERYMPLQIVDVNDAEQVAAVAEGLTALVGPRRQVEKTRKRLKAASLDYGRRVDAEAKRITAGIVEIEAHLEAEYLKVTREKERLAAELKETVRQATVDRLVKLHAVGLNPPFDDVAAMTTDEFEAVLAEATAAHAEAARVAEGKRAAKQAADEETRRAAEATTARLKVEREAFEAEQVKRQAEIDAQRAELQRIRDEQAESQAKLEADRRAVYEAHAALEQQRRGEASERARAAQADDALVAQVIAKELAAKLRPDAEKIRAVAAELDAITFELSSDSPEAIEADFRLKALLTICASDIRELAATLGE